MKSKSKKRIIKEKTPSIRFGLGYDVHRLVEGRKLFLGGVHIPSKIGLLGHSDADVLLHAICDALLGAAALGDIGKHFPDTDAAYRDISSLKLLGQVGILLKQHGYQIGNIDSTVILEHPKIAKYVRFDAQPDRKGTAHFSSTGLYQGHNSRRTRCYWQKRGVCCICNSIHL